jgi:hypothetical protein
MESYSESLFTSLCCNEMLGNVGARKPKSKRISFSLTRLKWGKEKESTCLLSKYNTCDVDDDESLETNHLVCYKNFKIQSLLAIITSHFIFSFFKRHFHWFSSIEYSNFIKHNTIYLVAWRKKIIYNLLLIKAFY